MANFVDNNTHFVERFSIDNFCLNKSFLKALLFMNIDWMYITWVRETFYHCKEVTFFGYCILLHWRPATKMTISMRARKRIGWFRTLSSRWTVLFQRKDWTTLKVILLWYLWYNTFVRLITGFRSLDSWL